MSKRPWLPLVLALVAWLPVVPWVLSNNWGTMWNMMLLFSCVSPLLWGTAGVLSFRRLQAATGDAPPGEAIGALVVAGLGLPCSFWFLARLLLR